MEELSKVGVSDQGETFFEDTVKVYPSVKKGASVMQRMFYRLIAIVVLLFLAWCCVFISIMSSSVVDAHVSSLVGGINAVAIATATATATTSSGNGGGLDPTIIAAIIGACIAGIFGILGIAYGARLQRRIVRYQKELDTQGKTQEQEEQRKAETLETTRRQMLLAQNTAE